MCGACCIAISISSIIPELNRGKRAGERCIHLGEDNLCKIFNRADRPKVCGDFQAEELFCGNSREEAMEILCKLEGITISNLDI